MELCVFVKKKMFVDVRLLKKRKRILVLVGFELRYIVFFGDVIIEDIGYMR